MKLSDGLQGPLTGLKEVIRLTAQLPRKLGPGEHDEPDEKCPSAGTLLVNEPEEPIRASDVKPAQNDKDGDSGQVSDDPVMRVLGRFRVSEAVEQQPVWGPLSGRSYSLPRWGRH